MRKSLLLFLLTLFSLALPAKAAETITFDFSPKAEISGLYNQNKNVPTSEQNWSYSATEDKQSYNFVSKGTYRTSSYDYIMIPGGAYIQLPVFENKIVKSIGYTTGSQMSKDAGIQLFEGSSTGTPLSSSNVGVTTQTNTLEIKDGKASDKYFLVSSVSGKNFQLKTIVLTLEDAVTEPDQPVEYHGFDQYDEQTLTFAVNGFYQLKLGDKHPDIIYEIEPEGIISITKDGKITATQEGEEILVAATWGDNTTWVEGSAMFYVTVTSPGTTDPEPGDDENAHKGDVTININNTDLNNPNTNYVSEEFSFTIDGVEFGINNINPGNGQARGNNNSNSSNFYLYNKTPIANIEAVVLTYTDKTSGKIVSDKAYLVVDTKVLSEITTDNGTNPAVDETSSPKTATFTASSSDKSYFRIQFTTGATSGTFNLARIDIITKVDAVDYTQDFDDLELTYGDVDKKLYLGDKYPENIKFEFGNPDIVSIDADGNITVLNAGETSVKMSWENQRLFKEGFKEFNVKVKKAEYTADIFNQTYNVIIDNSLEIKIDKEHPEYKFPENTDYFNIELSEDKSKIIITGVKATETPIEVVLTWKDDKNYEDGSAKFSVSVNKKTFVPTFQKEYRMTVGDSPIYLVGEEDPGLDFTIADKDQQAIKIEEGKLYALAETESPIQVNVKWGNDTYATGSSSFQVAVDPYEPNVEFNFPDIYSSVTDNTAISGTEHKDANDIVSVTFTKTGSESAPAYYKAGTAVRAYGGNKITVKTKQAGFYLSKVEFTFGDSDTPSKAITSDKETFTSPTWTATKDKETEVIFSIASGSGNRRIKKIQVFYKQEFKPELDDSYNLVLNYDENVLDLNTTLSVLRPQNITLSTEEDGAVTVDNNTLAVQAAHVGSATVKMAWESDKVFLAGETSFTVNVALPDRFTDELTAASFKEIANNQSYFSDVYTPVHGLTSYAWVARKNADGHLRVNSDYKGNETIQNKSGVALKANEYGYIVDEIKIKWASTNNTAGRGIVLNGKESESDWTYDSTDGLFVTDDSNITIKEFIYDPENLEQIITNEDIELSPEHFKGFGFTSKGGEIFLESVSVTWTKPYAKEYTSLSVYDDQNPLEFNIEGEGQLELGHCHPNITWDYDNEALNVDEETGKVTATKAGMFTLSPKWNNEENRWLGNDKTVVNVKVIGKEFKPEFQTYTLLSMDGEIIKENESVDLSSLIPADEPLTMTLSTDDTDLITINGLTITAKDKASGTATVKATWEGTVWEKGEATFEVNVVRSHAYTFEATRITDPSEVVEDNYYIMLGYNLDSKTDFYMAMTAYDETSKSYGTEQARFEEGLEPGMITKEHHPLASDAITIVKFEKDDDGVGFHMNVNALNDEDPKYITTQFKYNEGGNNENKISLEPGISNKSYVTVEKYDEGTDRMMLLFSHSADTDEVAPMAAEEAGEAVISAFQYQPTFRKFSAYIGDKNSSSSTGLYLYRLYYRQPEDLANEASLAFEVDRVPEGVEFSDIETENANHLIIKLKFSKENADDFEIDVNGKTYMTGLTDGKGLADLNKVTHDMTGDDSPEVKVRYIIDKVPSRQFDVDLTNLTNPFEDLKLTEAKIAEEAGYTFNAHSWDGSKAYVSLSLPYVYEHNAPEGSHFVAEYTMENNDVTYDQSTHTATINDYTTVELSLEQCKDPQAIRDALNDPEMELPNVKAKVTLHFPIVYVKSPEVTQVTPVAQSAMAKAPEATEYGTHVYTTELDVEHTISALNGNTTTGVDGIEADQAEAEFYTLQGVRVDKPVSGSFYIVRVGTKTAKVFVK